MISSRLSKERMRSPAGAGSQDREGEYGILVTMGISMRQWLVLVGIEGVLVLLLGLLAGTLVGLGLSYSMIPYLSQALAGSLAGITVERIAVEWSAIARLYGLLVVVFGAALAVLLVILGQSGGRRTADDGRRTKDEGLRRWG